MAKARIEIPYSFLRDLQKASAVLELLLEDCEDLEEGMNIWSAQCMIDRITHNTECTDGIYAYTYERR